jgi:hypothetical protein
MKTASWIILIVAGGLMLLASLFSLGRAYSSAGDEIGGASLTELSAGRPEVETALRARRATAAAFAAGFATFLLATTLGPYRRGDVWAWWAIAAATVVVVALVLLRVPLLGTRSGTGAAVVQLVVVGVGLVLGAGRLGGRRPLV